MHELQALTGTKQPFQSAPADEGGRCRIVRAVDAQDRVVSIRARR